MKNRRIIQAYDSINPTQAQRDRMLENILSRADVSPEYQAVPMTRREPVVFRAKPSKPKKRSLLPGLAACLAVLILSGAMLKWLSREPSDPAPMAASATEPTADSATVNLSYAPVLEKYRTALEEGWSKEQCEIEGISTRFYMPEPVDYVIGKRILDINGDGRAELLIGHDNSLWDVYATLEDGTPVQILSDCQDGWQYYLCQDGTLAAEYYSKEDCYAEYYKLDGYRLVMQEQFQYQDGQWMREAGEQEWETLDTETAEAMMGRYTVVTPDWMPLNLTENQVSSDSRDALERYTPVLEKYRTALLENWDEEKCSENDISPLLVSDAEIARNLGWCLQDLDGNGTQELIISDGVYLYDLFVLMPNDGGPGHVLCANGGETYRLCENGVIQNQGLYSGTAAWRYYTLVDIDIIQQDIVFYDGELNQYYYGADGEDLEPISKDEAGKLLFRYPDLKLTVTPFAEQKPVSVDAMAVYADLLETYRKALEMDYHPAACLEKSISLMVAHCGEYYDQLGYALMDLDGNGTEELIITDGTNIFDLYTIVPEETPRPKKLFSAMERIQYYLTEDREIYHFGSDSASANYQTVSRLVGQDLVQVEGYFYDGKTDPSNPWYFYDGKEIGEACGFDAQASLDAYKTVEISFIPFA